MFKNSVTIYVTLLIAFLLLGGAFAAFILPGLEVNNSNSNSPEEEVIITEENSETENREEEIVENLASHPALEKDLVEIVEEAGPSVVKITTIREQVGYDFFLRQFRHEVPGEGSGVIFDEEGYILTNNHVVENASRISVILPGEEEREYQGEVIGTDDVTDLAVVKIDTDQSLPVASIGDSDRLRVGEVAIAIGNPYGLTNSVTVGVISALGRSIPLREGTELTDVIQTDAAINPGNSGGALINGAGEVIGINTAIIQQAQGIGFSIPIKDAMAVAGELIEHGYVARPWLGIYGGTISSTMAREYNLPIEKGVFVVRVMPNSPADRAGLQAEDIIVEVSGEEMNTMEALVQDIQNRDIEETITLTIYRGDERKEIEVELEAAPQD